MRIAIVGATGNVGTSLVHALADAQEVDSIIGIARRRPELDVAKTTWAEADVAEDDLTPLFADADVVVHLAWLVQPSRDLDFLWRVNVEGSSRIFRAAADAGVQALVYASSVGAYSPGPKGRLVDESWPAAGTPTSYYGRQKAEVERRLDDFEREHPHLRVARLRPGLVFKREAATEIRRFFAGPFLPRVLVRPAALPFVPNVPELRFQAVHAEDVADAYRRAALGDARGAFNVAADPIVDPPLLADLLHARLVPIPAGVVRAAVAALWRLHVLPIPEGWVDLALSVPLLDTTRARTELGWSPRRGADEALLELLDGIREGAGEDTPPLSPKTGGPLRSRELTSGVGRKGGA